MKDFAWKVKVSDILLNPGSLDKISFEAKSSTKIENLSDSWISGDIIIEWLDEKSIFVILQNIKAETNEICEVSWKKFLRKANIDEYSMKFLTLNKNEDINDDYLLIDKKDLTIDLEEMVVQAIILNRPVCMKSETVLEQEKNHPEIEQDDSFGSSWVSNTINWTYKNN